MNSTTKPDGPKKQPDEPKKQPGWPKKQPDWPKMQPDDGEMNTSRAGWTEYVSLSPTFGVAVMSALSFVAMIFVYNNALSTLGRVRSGEGKVSLMEKTAK